MNNTERFIYVFDKESRDEMVAAGFKLLKSDKKNDVYVFANRNDMAFELAGLSFARSDTLTF